ncbi:hypothetical protein M011DRAFT_468963 [Sporormia fimetaria CBS 119925]|uniref:magnesium chelatase n=1 Tax=Sporormia fimetaria CBS 119925 TaxID=1340428 RepID=A0A6A6V8T0_9PLEO|nr:hypothetical protein M011DRAFT_468963 [Sporormia fimetaria CBS 119925]
MAKAGDSIVEKAQALSDLELAVLICLVADQHCIITAEKDHLIRAQIELQDVASQTFGLSCAVLDCSSETTLDDFGSGMLVESPDQFDSEQGYVRTGSEIFSSSDTMRGSEKRSAKMKQPAFSSMDTKRLANIVIARNLSTASRAVQLHALELLRSKRIYTRTAVHAAPRPFLFIALNATGSARLTNHLNDRFFISHEHRGDDEPQTPEDVDSIESRAGDDTSIAPQTPQIRTEPTPTFSIDDITTLTTLTSTVTMTSELRAYLHNIIVFMRLHRAVAGGISALATRHFTQLAHVLAPLHGLSYITPSLVALAARKVYPHRIVITSPERERSMQWGSSLEAVKAVLEGVGEVDVVEEVLQSVEAPL